MVPWQSPFQWATVLVVSYVVTTSLGRVLPLERWRDVHKDTILKILYDLRTIDSSGVLTLGVLSAATGLSPDQTRELCKELSPYVDAVGAGTYRISEKGASFVEDNVRSVQAAEIG